jgi:glycerophosphoryl diester phosphodiesterase
MLRCDKVLNIAHGGGLLIRPDHTILAYDQALEDGADMLELDIHETRDNVIVVMHDETVDDTTNCTGLIKEKTFAELLECDAGYKWTQDGGETYPYRDMGLVVPSLEEVLERYPDTPVNIEIKQSEPSLVDGLVDLVRQYEFEDKMGRPRSPPAWVKANPWTSGSSPTRTSTRTTSQQASSFSYRYSTISGEP